MAESTLHLHLVEGIIRFIREGNVGAVDNLAVLHDLPGAIGCPKPPAVGAFRPDVYAISTPPAMAIIGEAKTSADLDTQHTRDQFHAYLRHLLMHHRSFLIVAVPWQLVRRARYLATVAQHDIAETQTKIVILDGLT